MFSEKDSNGSKFPAMPDDHRQGFGAKPLIPGWPGNPVAYLRFVFFQRQVGRFGQVVSCTSNDCTGFLQNNCPGGLIGKVFPDSFSL